MKRAKKLDNRKRYKFVLSRLQAERMIYAIGSESHYDLCENTLIECKKNEKLYKQLIRKFAKQGGQFE